MLSTQNYVTVQDTFHSYISLFILIKMVKDNVTRCDHCWYVYHFIQNWEKTHMCAWLPCTTPIFWQRTNFLIDFNFIIPTQLRMLFAVHKATNCYWNWEITDQMSESVVQWNWFIINAWTYATEITMQILMLQNKTC